MRWLRLNEMQAKMVDGAIKGALRGGPVTALASIVSGAAVVVTAPAWIPIVGGITAISMTAVTAAGVIGAGVGAAAGATAAFFKKRRTEKDFREAGFKEPEATGEN